MEIWGERINDYYESKLVIAGFFVDRSSELAAGGDILHTPNTTEFTTTAKTIETAVTLNYPTETSIDLTVDQWYEASFAIEDNDVAQIKHSYYVQDRYAKNCGFAVAKKLEVALASLFDNFSQTVGASTSTLADSEIREAIAYLEVANIDTTEGCAFFMHPNVFWKQVQNLDKFSLAVNSPVNDPTGKTPKATLYGIPVYISTNIQRISGTVGRTNALAYSDALHWATSPLGSGGSKSGGSMTGKYGVRVQSNYIPEYLSTITTADLLYGVVENRDTSGVAILTSDS